MTYYIDGPSKSSSSRLKTKQSHKPLISDINFSFANKTFFKNSNVVYGWPRLKSSTQSVESAKKNWVKAEI